jgi:hypothetical protein
MGAAGVLVAAAGCRQVPLWPESWGATTRYRFSGLTESDAPAFERMFKERGLGVRRVADAPITFEVTGIDSTLDFQSVQKGIAALAAERKIDLPLESVVLSYGGLQAAGDVATIVEVTASPGSRAFVADGPPRKPWREVPLDRAGKWKGPVTTSGAVQDAGGWLYIAATRGDFFRYSRVHVISKAQEAVTFTQFKATNFEEPSLAPARQ